MKDVIPQRDSGLYIQVFCARAPLSPGHFWNGEALGPCHWLEFNGASRQTPPPPLQDTLSWSIQCPGTGTPLCWPHWDSLSAVRLTGQQPQEVPLLRLKTLTARNMLIPSLLFLWQWTEFYQTILSEIRNYFTWFLLMFLFLSIGQFILRL